jgi:hypothetical protein
MGVEGGMYDIKGVYKNYAINNIACSHQFFTQRGSVKDLEGLKRKTNSECVGSCPLVHFNLFAYNTVGCKSGDKKATLNSQNSNCVLKSHYKLSAAASTFISDKLNSTKNDLW